MNYSVIIPTCNRKKDLSVAIDSILRQSSLPLEIIVVDQSNSDATKNYTESIRNEYKAKVDIVYSFQNEKNLVKARNKGISLTSGDIISFLDDDIVLFNDYFENILRYFDSDKLIGGLSGNLIVKDRFQRWNWKLRKVLLRLFLLNNFDGKMTISGFGYPVFGKEITHYFQVEMLLGHNMSFRREFLEDDKFDEWFSGYGYREDADLSYRISRKAILGMVAEAKLYHNNSKVSRMDLEAHKIMEVKNHYYFYKKHARKNILTDFLFTYSLVGMFIILVIEYLSNSNSEKYSQLRGFFRGVIKLISTDE